MNLRTLKCPTAWPDLDAALERASVRVARAQTELRQGRVLLVLPDEDDAPVLLAAAVESLSATRLHLLSHAGAPPRLLLSAERLRALGAPAAQGAGTWVLGAPISIERLQRLAAVRPGTLAAAEFTGARPASPAMQTALAVCKRARLVPALVVVELPRDRLAALRDLDLLSVSTADWAALPHSPLDADLRLRRVSDARVPLAGHDDCTLVLYRELDSELEHLAVVVGQPDPDQPVPVRLHSACLSGDLLGSLRCDCGDQLRRSVHQLAQHGGVLVYLAHEGRGLGLANTLRAFRLQDAGLADVAADRHLGFSGDERDFAPAVAILQDLGVQRLRLLTTNAHKADCLRRGGLEVLESVALPGPVHAPAAQTQQACL